MLPRDLPPFQLVFGSRMREGTSAQSFSFIVLTCCNETTLSRTTIPSRWRMPIAAPTVAAEGMAEIRSSSET